MKVLILLLLAATVFAQFQCPEKDGFYPDPEQCDLYYKCVDGRAEDKLCPDGLFFNSERTNRDRCEEIVDCGNRVYIQEPTNPSPECYRAYGYFANNEGKCDVYYKCVKGIATELSCPKKSYFEEELGICARAANEDEYQEMCGVDGPSAPEFECPEEDGEYPDEEQCDKYYVCKGGDVEVKLCDDGLGYDIRSQRCDVPGVVVNCGERTKRQPARPTGNPKCPRLYGTYEDKENCGIYYTCNSGEHNVNNCPAGLHYSLDVYTCVWPQGSGRTGCAEKKKQLPDGFSCPDDVEKEKDLQRVAHPTFVHKTDCRKFYICLNGKTPQLGGCNLGEVFNGVRCDYPENVPRCEGYYKDHPMFEHLYDDYDGDGERDFADKKTFSTREEFRARQPLGQ